jgi:hypothetical protein
LKAEEWLADDADFDAAEFGIDPNSVYGILEDNDTGAILISLIERSSLGSRQRRKRSLGF